MAGQHQKFSNGAFGANITKFEGGARAEKRNFLVKHFYSAQNVILSLFFNVDLSLFFNVILSLFFNVILSLKKVDKTFFRNPLSLENVLRTPLLSNFNPSKNI